MAVTPYETKQTIRPKRSCEAEPDGVKKTGRHATASLRTHSKISNHATRSSYPLSSLATFPGSRLRSRMSSPVVLKLAASTQCFSLGEQPRVKAF